MKRTAFLLVLLALLAGCATTPALNEDGSPYWTTHIPKKTRTTYYAVASAKQSTEALSTLRAESAAKDMIGRWAETTIDSSVVTFIEEAGETLRTRQVLEVLQNLSVQTVDIALRGVKIVERWVRDDGTVYVLASYPVKHLKEAYRLQAEELERKALADAIRAEVLEEYLQNLLEATD
ncbi:MAG: hypothetical protein GX911_05685 [Spirochaetales bacterium]|nr:hypothetical protein [Spirochaetales bacterium]